MGFLRLLLVFFVIDFVNGFFVGPPGWTPPAISSIVLVLSRPEPRSQAGKAYTMLFWYGPAQLALAWLLLAALT